MKPKIRAKLSYANVTATIAVFLALGGGAYAVTIAPKNSVLSRSIKNRQVKKADLANGAVTNPKLATDAVTSANVLDNSLTGNDVNESTLGQVPSAAHADSADTAAHADSATNADKLGGLLPSAFQSSSSFVRITGVPSGTSFGPVSGVAAANVTNSNVEQLTPAGGSITAKDLSAEGFLIGNGTVTLEVFGSDTSLTCTTAVASTGCEDTTHSVSIPAHAGLSFKVVAPGSGGAVRIGWVAAG
jgi:hypothetical protein